MDVRVAHLHAARYRTRASRVPGYAAAYGEGEKHDRYPPAQGREVIAVVHETWGRLGTEAEEFLEHLAAASRRRGLRRGRDSVSTLARWRERIDGTLHKAVAVQLAAAARGLPGKRPYRKAPIDLEGLEVGAAV